MSDWPRDRLDAPDRPGSPTVVRKPPEREGLDSDQVCPGLTTCVQVCPAVSQFDQVCPGVSRKLLL